MYSIGQRVQFGFDGFTGAVVGTATLKDGVRQIVHLDDEFQSRTKDGVRLYHIVVHPHNLRAID